MYRLRVEIWKSIGAGANRVCIVYKSVENILLYILITLKKEDVLSIFAVSSDCSEELRMLGIR